MDCPLPLLLDPRFTFSPTSMFMNQASLPLHMPHSFMFIFPAIVTIAAAFRL
jgi:hypothetical protein